jgi:DhnA family fructose-bisphosphate aldolase class Ia
MNHAPILRLRRITNPKTGRALLLSFTSGLELGPVSGLSDLPATVCALAETGLITGAVVNAGAARSLFDRLADLPCGLIVGLFGGTMLTSRPDHREQVCSLEHAIRVGADAVLATIGLGSADESLHLRLCGQIVREAALWGLPVVLRVDTTQTDARRQYSATLSGHGARLAYELGADLVVVNYSDSGAAFADAMLGVSIPVLIGGGPHMETDEALLSSVAQAMKGGAQGVALAAPLFWRDGPTTALNDLAQIVYS